MRTARRWADRYRGLGRAGMVDQSSRPRRSTNRTVAGRERRVVGLRVSRRWGPARIAYLLGVAVSTVHKILRCYGHPPLSWTDPVTGVRVRGPHGSRREVRRYQWDQPGDMAHVDIKKLGRIPDGGGHKVLGRAGGRRNRKVGTG